jgi:hypothetical protein
MTKSTNTHNLNSVDIMIIVDALIEQSKDCGSVTTALMSLELINKVKALTPVKVEHVQSMEQILNELEAG